MDRMVRRPLVCPDLIGRVPELSMLRELVEQASGGQGRVALVAGQAGIGKTRLVREAQREAAMRGFLIYQGACYPTDHSCPYAPWLDLLRPLVASAPIPAALEPLAAAWSPLFPDLPPGGAGQAPAHAPQALDPAQEQRRRFETLARFLTTQAAAQPVLVTLEDLHWSDESSLECLGYLARRGATSRLLLLATYRSDEVPSGLRRLLAQFDRERLAHECALARLTQAEVEAMLRAIFALPDSARLDFADAIYALTEGNPFFIEEVLKTFLETGEIFFTQGRWRHKPLGEVHIPRSVQDTVQQRTERLSEPAREVATLAAVVGRRFDFSLLQRLTGDDEPRLLQAIKELVASQMVVEESAERFVFRHALTRQAIYADLLARERRALHQRVASAMEGLYSTDAQLDAHLADLAYHFYEAGAWDKALDYGQRAAERAGRMYTPRAVAEQAALALDAAQQGSIPVPVALYRLRGQAYETLGDFEPARMDLESALQLARASGDQQREWQALMDLGFLWVERDYAQAGAMYQQALALARQIAQPVTLAHSLNRLGNWHMNLEQISEALRLHKEALAVFQQAGDRPGVAATYDLLGMASCLAGDVIEGLAHFEQAVALFRELGDRQGLASCLASMTTAAGQYEMETMPPASMGYAECIQSGEQALAIAREIGQRSAEAYALLNLSQARGPRGEYAHALELAHAGLALAEQIEHRQWMTYGHWALGALTLDLLAGPLAERHLEQTLALAREIGSWHWIEIARAFLARLRLWQGDLDRAEALLTPALPSDASLATLVQRQSWDTRASLALARNEPQRALDIVERLIGSAANPHGQVIPHLWKARGQALAALGRTAEAEATLQAASASAREQGLRPLLWRILLAQGQLYQTQARKADAEQAFAAARAIIEELAAALPDEPLRAAFLSSTRLLLPRPRALTPRRANKQAYAGLTEREREVAGLIAAGCSNREIAGQLVVGPRTIEAHVSSILSKLGFSSRAQIAAWATEKGLKASTV
jgi:predicted ATPase/DNA-binding CsgD family transcriptional regulator